MLEGQKIAGVVLCCALLGCGKSQDAPVPPNGASLEKPKRMGVVTPRHPLIQAANQIAPSGRLPFYELQMDPRDLARLEQTAYSNDTYPATFIANGIRYEKVRVRFRGQWARTWPKKPLKIFFDHDQLFEAQRCLNLNSGWRDPAFVRETVAYQVYAACGVPAPQSQMVRLHINGKFRGLYVQVEQPDKAFLSRVNFKGASLFKGISRSNWADERDLGPEASYKIHYNQETQKTDGYGDLQKFCHDLAGATNTLEFFVERVDVERYINYLAATVLVQHWDCFNKNHFLLYDGRSSKKWCVVPFDLDRTFGDDWRGPFDQSRLPILLGTHQMPGTTGWNRLEDRFFAEPALRSRFYKRLGELLEKEFTPEKLFPILDRLESDIADSAVLDRELWPSPTPDLHSGIAEVKRYIKGRRAYLLGELSRVRQAESPP